MFLFNHKLQSKSWKFNKIGCPCQQQCKSYTEIVNWLKWLKEGAYSIQDSFVIMGYQFGKMNLNYIECCSYLLMEFDIGISYHWINNSIRNFIHWLYTWISWKLYFMFSVLTCHLSVNSNLISLDLHFIVNTKNYLKRLHFDLVLPWSNRKPLNFGGVVRYCWGALDW